MKMIIAIVQAEDENSLQQAFVKNNIRSTKLATKGLFLRQGNTTFLIGTPDEEVEKVLTIIKNKSKSREEYVSPTIFPANFAGIPPVKVSVGGATVFVLPVEQFKQY